MFKITDNTIEITRGDKGSIELNIDDYTFGTGDEIRFRVYAAKGLNSEPYINKLIVVEEPSESISIDLTSEETKIGEMVNKAVTYWYEVELNGDETVIGYDENGAKEFILYPEGAEFDAR